MKRARLIPFRKHSPLENMATDEYLISYYENTGIPALRLYGWDPPGITIGRNQDCSIINRENCAPDRVNFVRRITGGGAIFHDRELTYSVVYRDKDIGNEGLSIRESFEKLNLFILGMYRRLGFHAVYAKDSLKYINGRGIAPFCFAGNEEFDIIINNKKIGGNARRKCGDVILQHGSIPVKVNREKLRRYFNYDTGSENFTSLNELSGRDVSAEEIAEALIRSFTESFAFELAAEGLNNTEKKIIYRIIKTKYSKAEWNITKKDNIKGAHCLTKYY